METENSLEIQRHLQDMQDRDHLNILSISHYVFGAIMVAMIGLGYLTNKFVQNQIGSHFAPSTSASGGVAGGLTDLLGGIAQRGSQFDELTEAAEGTSLEGLLGDSGIGSLFENEELAEVLDIIDLDQSKVEEVAEQLQTQTSLTDLLGTLEASEETGSSNGAKTGSVAKKNQGFLGMNTVAGKLKVLSVLIKILIVLHVLGAILTLLCGWLIKKRKGRKLTLFTAYMNLMAIPFGTILSIFALNVLGRDSVKELYDAA